MEFAGILAQNRWPLCSNLLLFEQENANNVPYNIRYFVTGQISINIASTHKVKNNRSYYAFRNKPIINPPSNNIQAILRPSFNELFIWMYDSFKCTNNRLCQ